MILLVILVIVALVATYWIGYYFGRVEANKELWKIYSEQVESMKEGAVFWKDAYTSLYRVWAKRYPVEADYINIAKASMIVTDEEAIMFGSSRSGKGRGIYDQVTKDPNLCDVWSTILLSSRQDLDKLLLKLIDGGLEDEITYHNSFGTIIFKADK